MELIDRKALREAITSKYCAECGSDQNCDKGYVADPNTAVICETKTALDALDAAPTIDAEPVRIDGNTSDGYHTFNELYHHRAVLFSVIVRAFQDKAWKSKLHHDGTIYDGMFIVGIKTPDGQATYHYDIDPYWDMFDCREVERAPEWDGHTPDQAIERIGKLKPEPVRHGMFVEDQNTFCGYDRSNYKCTKCGKLIFTAVRNLSREQMWDYCPCCGARMDGGNG